MIIIDDNWCFIHIPKTSGTNFRRCLPYDNMVSYHNNEFWDEFWADTQLPMPGMEHFDIKYISPVKHAPLSFWQKNNVVTHHKIFTIVRNPYTRLLSFFNEVKRDLMGYEPNITSLSLQQFIDDDLIQQRLDYTPYNIFSLKTNQLDYFYSINGNLTLHKFFKMETEIDQLQKFFNTSDLNSKKHNSFDYDRDYKNIFTDEIISWVQCNYKRDFEYFNYSLEPFW